MKRKLAETLGLIILCALVIVVSIAVVGGGNKVSASTQAWTGSVQASGSAQFPTP